MNNNIKLIIEPKFIADLKSNPQSDPQSFEKGKLYSLFWIDFCSLYGYTRPYKCLDNLHKQDEQWRRFCLNRDYPYYSLF